MRESSPGKEERAGVAGGPVTHRTHQACLAARKGVGDDLGCLVPERRLVEL